MSVKEQLIELGNKYLKLEKELKENAKILENYKNNLIRLLKEDNITIFRSNDEKLLINMNEQKKFDSKKLREDKPEMYEEFRIETKTFNKKELERIRPDIYEMYHKIITIKLKVERLKNKKKSS